MFSTMALADESNSTPPLPQSMYVAREEKSIETEKRNSSHIGVFSSSGGQIDAVLYEKNTCACTRGHHAMRW